MIFQKYQVSLIGFIVLFCGLSLFADVPGMVSYQGRLFEDTGSPVNDISLPVSFSLFDGETGSVILWSESKAIEVENGLFNVILGDSVTIPPAIFSGLTVYMEMTVSGETLTPRQRMLSVPYAFMSQTVADGSIGSAQIVDGTISSTDVAFNYAGSASQGGAATTAQDLSCVECIDDNEIDFNYADSKAKGGPALGLSCGDCLNETQIQDLFVLNTSDSMSGGLTIGEDLEVTGANVGIGRAPHEDFGILMDPATAPNWGGLFYGNLMGLDVRYAPDYSAGWVMLAQENKGVFSRSGNNFATADRYAGDFEAYSSANAYGLYSNGYGRGAGDAIGVKGIGSNSSTGDAYGGHFISLDQGTGTHYGVYTESDEYPFYAVNTQDPTNNNVYLADDTHGVDVEIGNSTITTTLYGADINATGNGSVYGSRSTAAAYGSGSATAVKGTIYHYGSGTSYGGYFNITNNGTGNHYGVSALAFGTASTPVNIGVSAQATGADAGDNYALYAFVNNTTDYALYAPYGQKSWVNPDPEDPDQSVVYVTLEGGFAGTYFAGRASMENGKAIVILPDHFRKVTSPDKDVMVTVTPRGRCNGLMVPQSNNEEFTVEELQDGQNSVEFDFIVMGFRRGYEEYEPIQKNLDYVPFENNLSDMDTSVTSTQDYYDNQSEGLKKIFKENGTIKNDGKINDSLFKYKGWKNIKRTAP